MREKRAIKMRTNPNVNGNNIKKKNKTNKINEITSLFKFEQRKWPAIITN